MKNDSPAFNYQQAAARGATPVAQIVLLYDTILRDFGRALTALQNADVETRVAELNHALLVVGHLQSVLDHQRGGDAAAQLDRFYALTRGMILDANIQAVPEALRELIDLYRGLRDAWKQVENSPDLPNPVEFARAGDRGDIEIQKAPSVSEDAEPGRFQWSA
jgi:flagellar secretion chaperone FliS